MNPSRGAVLIASCALGLPASAALARGRGMFTDIPYAAWTDDSVATSALPISFSYAAIPAK